MYIEENLAAYLEQHKYVLIRGIDAYHGMQFLKRYVPKDREFVGIGTESSRILESLECPTGDKETATHIMIGTCTELNGCLSTGYPIWYFKNLGSDRSDRLVRRHFDLVLDFSNGKILGASKSRFLKGD